MGIVTKIPINSYLLQSSQSSVTFNSIPDSYRTLILTVDASNTGASAVAGDAKITLNSDTTTTMSEVRINGNGSSAVSDRSSNGTCPFYLTYSMHIPGSSYGRAVMNLTFVNYSDTSKYKNILSQMGSKQSSDVKISAYTFHTLNKISSMQIDAISQNFTSGSVFTIYGVM